MSNYDFKKAKEEYREFCKKEPTLNVYMQDWFLDAACNSPDDWKVILVKDGEDIIGAFPFEYIKIKGFWRIQNPWQAVYLGWIKYPLKCSVRKKFEILKDVINKFINALPYYDVFHITFNKDFNDWHPFYWNGFNQTTYYTSVIENISEENILSLFSQSLRSKIRSQNKKYRILVNNISPSEYLSYMKKTYKNRGKQLAYCDQRFIKLIFALLEHNAAQTRVLLDEERNEILAANIIFIDNNRCYWHFGTQFKRQSDSSNCSLFYDSIKYTMKNNKTFDFEGSMIKSVYETILYYGVALVPIYHITNYSDKYKLIKSLSEIPKLIKNVLFYNRKK